MQLQKLKGADIKKVAKGKLKTQEFFLHLLKREQAYFSCNVQYLSNALTSAAFHKGFPEMGLRSKLLSTKEIRRKL